MATTTRAASATGVRADLRDRATAVVAGSAVGDALGGAAEGNTPAAIQQRYGGTIEGVVGPFNADWRHARPIAPYHKGDGHVTDDTLMTDLLIDTYREVRRHLTAHDVAEHLVPRMIGAVRWIPELEAEALPLHRVFLAEKWLVARLHYGHIDPREAGVGNVVNCGATMYVAPIGVVNAGDPAGAYAEAIDVAGAHQSSYGREAAGVFAAAVAAACVPGASVDDVVGTAVALAKDGTREAIEAVAEVAAGLEGWRGDGLSVLRDAVRPFDTVGEDYRAPARDARLPNRTKSIEELPIAFGLLLACGGDYRESVLGSVNYGRDSDSIAVMAGSVAGALGGSAAVPEEWIDQVGEASRMDLRAGGPILAEVAAEVLAADERRLAGRRAAAQTLGLTS